MANKINDTVAYNVKLLRLEKRMSQQTLADQAGLSKQMISNIENGMNSSTQNLEKIAYCLAVPPLSLYREPDTVDNEVRFKRITQKVEEKNTRQYVLDLEKSVQAITGKAMNQMYQQIVMPTVHEAFNQNKTTLLIELDAQCSEANKQTVDAFEAALLESIERALINQISLSSSMT